MSDDPNFKKAMKCISLAAELLGWDIAVFNDGYCGENDDDADVLGILLLNPAKEDRLNPDKVSEELDIGVDTLTIERGSMN